VNVIQKQSEVWEGKIKQAPESMVSDQPAIAQIRLGARPHFF
jgi:hypothetical protein